MFKILKDEYSSKKIGIRNDTIEVNFKTLHTNKNPFAKRIFELIQNETKWQYKFIIENFNLINEHINEATTDCKLINTVFAFQFIKSLKSIGIGFIFVVDGLDRIRLNDFTNDELTSFLRTYYFSQFLAYSNLRIGVKISVFRSNTLTLANRVGDFPISISPHYEYIKNANLQEIFVVRLCDFIRRNNILKKLMN